MFSDSPPFYRTYPILRSSLISEVNSDNEHLCEVLSRNNQESSLDSRFSRGSRIERQRTFERYRITKLGLAEGEETSKSFKVVLILFRLLNRKLKMTLIQNQGLLTRLKRLGNLVNFSSSQRDGADVPSFSKPFYCHCGFL